MGIWKEIRYALNSTLGTTEFRPLDELIRYGGKQLIASDNTFLKLPISTARAESNQLNGKYGCETTDEVVAFRFTPLVGGSVRMTGTMNITDSRSGDIYAIGRLRIYVNDVLTHTISQNNSSGSPATVAVSQDIVFNAKDRIKVTLQSETTTSGTTMSHSVELSNIYLKADVTDNLIKVN